MISRDVDPVRAARAAEALRDGDVRIDVGDGPEIYLVQSFSCDRTYTVRLDDRRGCTCPDARYRNVGICKHVAAVLLAGRLEEGAP